MTAAKLRKQVESLVSHVLFDYNGKSCGIDPIDRQQIDVWYGDIAFTAKSIDEVMDSPFFDGKSLSQICKDITNIDM